MFEIFRALTPATIGLPPHLPSSHGNRHFHVLDLHTRVVLEDSRPANEGVSARPTPVARPTRGELISKANDGEQSSIPTTRGKLLLASYYCLTGWSARVDGEHHSATLEVVENLGSLSHDYRMSNLLYIRRRDIHTFSSHHLHPNPLSLEQ